MVTNNNFERGGGISTYERRRIAKDVIIEFVLHVLNTQHDFIDTYFNLSKIEDITDKELENLRDLLAFVLSRILSTYLKGKKFVNRDEALKILLDQRGYIIHDISHTLQYLGKEARDDHRITHEYLNKGMKFEFQSEKEEADYIREELYAGVTAIAQDPVTLEEVRHVEASLNYQQRRVFDLLGITQINPFNRTRLHIPNFVTMEGFEGYCKVFAYNFIFRTDLSSWLTEAIKRYRIERSKRTDLSPEAILKRYSDMCERRARLSIQVYNEELPQGVKNLLRFYWDNHEDPRVFIKMFELEAEALRDKMARKFLLYTKDDSKDQEMSSGDKG